MKDTKTVTLITTNLMDWPWGSPVWYVEIADDMLAVWTKPDSKKVANIARRQGRCTVYWPGDEDGHHFEAWRAEAQVFTDTQPTQNPDFLDKYGEDIEILHKLEKGPSVADFDDTFSTMLLVKRVGQLVSIP